MKQATIARRSNIAQLEERLLARVFAGYTISATAWLLFATFVGILLAYKFGAPDFGPGAWLTFRRLRPIHTNDTFFGWASIGLVSLAYLQRRRSRIPRVAVADPADLSRRAGGYHLESARHGREA